MPFRARINMISGFPVFVNQPSCERSSSSSSPTWAATSWTWPDSSSARPRVSTARRTGSTPTSAGEDVATVMLTDGPGPTSVVCEMAFAENPLERDASRRRSVFVEGDRGSLEVAPDYWVRVTTAEGTLARRHAPPRYAWADPAYEVVHASIVPCLANLLEASEGPSAETIAEDNLRTVRLIFAAYESAKHDRVIVFRVTTDNLFVRGG